MTKPSGFKIYTNKFIQFVSQTATIESTAGATLFGDGKNTQDWTEFSVKNNEIKKFLFFFFFVLLYNERIILFYF